MSSSFCYFKVRIYRRERKNSDILRNFRLPLKDSAWYLVKTGVSEIFVQIGVSSDHFRISFYLLIHRDSGMWNQLITWHICIFLLPFASCFWTRPDTQKTARFVENTKLRQRGVGRSFDLSKLKIIERASLFCRWNVHLTH